MSKYGEPWYPVTDDCLRSVTIKDSHNNIPFYFGEKATRAMLCVNALAGIEDPVEWIRDAIEFMSWAMPEINDTNKKTHEMKLLVKTLLEQANVEASDADKG